MSKSELSESSASMFHRLFLPPIILQSVLIGGGYSTGREVVQYAGRFGVTGWVSVVTIFVGFSVLSILVFELARTFRVYDYKNWIRMVIGPAWPAFDVLLVTMMILVIAVVVSAVGSIFEQTLGIPRSVGVIIAFLVSAILVFFGEEVIERFKTLGTLVLYGGYFLFGGLVLTSHGAEVKEAFQATDGIVGENWSSAMLSGLLYVGYNSAVFPVVIFALHRQTSRTDTTVSGIISGVMMTLPLALTWLCLLAFHTDDSVIKAEVPWLNMLDGLGGAWVTVVFGVVVGWTLVETATGSVHAIIDRVEKNSEDFPRAIATRLANTTSVHRGAFAAVILVTALLLSRFGIIALVARGYTLMAYGFILFLVVPLLTVGTYRIWRA